MNHPRNLTAPKRPEKWCLEDNPFLLSFPGRIVAFPGCIYFKSSDHFPPIHGIAPVGTTYSGLRPSHDCMVSLLANWDLAMNNDAQSLSCSSSFYLFFLIVLSSLPPSIFWFCCMSQKTHQLSIIDEIIFHNDVVRVALWAARPKICRVHDYRIQKKATKTLSQKKNLAKSGYVHTFCLFAWG